MKTNFRQSMAWLHTWVGLVLSWILYFIFVTGTLGYFDSEIDRWMTPETPTYHVQNDVSLPIAEAYLQQHAPDAALWDINLPIDRTEPYLWVAYKTQPENGKKSGRFQEESLNPYTGQTIEKRATSGGQTLYRMHYRLHYMPRQLAYYLVGICTMFMLLALITGIVIHKKIFREFFTLRRSKKPSSWLDGHNLLSVMSLPFHLMITYSGLLMFLFTYMPFALTAHHGFGKEEQQHFFDRYYNNEPPKTSGQPAKMLSLTQLYQKARLTVGEETIYQIELFSPNDANAQVAFILKPKSATQYGRELVLNAITGETIDWKESHQSSRAFYFTMLSLHEGLFADTSLRWLYFLTGLLGSAMLASGMILWTVKRRKKARKNGGGSIGYRLTEGMNIAAIIGFPIAVGVYFLSNRLLPLNMTDRANWEVHCMFIAWLMTFIHGIFRSCTRQGDKAWCEQLWLAGAVFISLPVVNALTTQWNFYTSLTEKQWIFVSFDLVAVFFAITCLMVARYLTKLFFFDQLAIPSQSKSTALANKA